MANTKITTSVIADGAITSAKLDTDISVSGTVTADGLTVDGDATISSNTGNSLTLNRPDGAGSPNILFQSNGTQTARLVTNASNDIVFERGTTDALKIEGSTGDISFYEDTGTTAKLFWDASAESLGIGTTSPSELLSLSSTNPRISLNDSDNAGTASTGLIEFDATDGRSGYMGMSGGQLILFADTTSDQIIKFVNGSGESMRIDSSGDLLISATSSSINAGSISLEAQGRIRAGRDGGAVMQLNRTTSDGDIAVFYKDGSTVGSIGASGGLPYFAGTSIGLKISGTQIRPSNSTGNNNDNAVDLGKSDTRFKDLYLSGGVVFDAVAGNATSNTLDDYEEGTYTPTITPATSGSVTTNTYTEYSYTKVGRLVTVTGVIRSDSQSSPQGDARISLPFTVADLSSLSGRSFGTVKVKGLSWGTSGYLVAELIEGNDYFTITVCEDNGSQSTLNANLFVSGIDTISVGFQYFTDA